MKQPALRWRDVADSLRSHATESTPVQRQLADSLGLRILDSTPSPVAARLLQEALSEPLQLQPRRSSVDESRLQVLRDYADQAKLELPDEIGSGFELDGWFSAVFAKLSAESLYELQPVPGDIVIRSHRPKELHEVSSIGIDGRIHMRGSGQRAHPNNLTMLARVDGDNYEELRRQAANLRAARAERSVVGPGSPRTEELEPYRVDVAVTQASRAYFSRALDGASDERPLQKVLEEHPALLSVLVPRNHGVWVLPQKQLGNQFRPDFLVAGMDSAGLKWVLVELETPTVEFSIRGGEYRQQLRHGIQQIHDWRNWLEENLDYARRAKKDHGLGLPGIRRAAAGLVLVGRSDGPTTDIDRNRQDTANEQNIAIHSYDWLLREARDENPMKWGALELDDDVDFFG